MTEEILLILCGALAGFVNGFLGSGGGIIIIVSLILMRKYKKTKESDAKSDFPSAICAILPMSLISLSRYSEGGNVDYSLVWKLAFPSAIGGIIGAFLLWKLNLKTVRKIFAVLIGISGVIMILK